VKQEGQNSGGMDGVDWRGKQYRAVLDQTLS
jgi:hypothetical protein